MPDERIVVDASVVLKWFHQEERTASALKLQEKIISGGVKATVPDLLLYEAANATVRGYGKGQKEVGVMFDILLDMPWDIISPAKELIVDAAGLAKEKQKLSVYDAAYVALAIQSSSKLITADERLHRLIGSPHTHLLH